LMVCTLAGAVLAGYGLDALLDASRKRAAITLGVVAVVAVLPLLWLAKHTYVFNFFGAALHQLPNIGKTAVPNGELELAVFLRWALFALIGVAIVALVAWRPRYAAVAAALAIAFTIADLVSYNRGFQPAIPPAWADPPKPEPIGLVQRAVGHERIAGRQEFGPNVPSRYGLRDARIYRPPPLERRTRLWQALGGEGSEHAPPGGRRAAGQPLRRPLCVQLGPRAGQVRSVEGREAAAAGREPPSAPARVARLLVAAGVRHG
ncbi:MAG TPA: hypothetical protein VGJ70_15850, partial [Solirubrobacteraceae bacterium]